MPKVKIKYKKDIINGFSYSFSRDLLDRLEQELNNNTLFEPENSCLGKDMPGFLNILGNNLVHYLEKQIPAIPWSNINSTIAATDPEAYNRDKSKFVEKHYAMVKNYIAEGNNFLKTFEGKL